MRWAVVAIPAVVLVVAGCGPGGDDAPRPSSPDDTRRGSSTLVRDDPAGDVLRTVVGSTRAPDPVPRRPGVDIRRMRVSHAPGTISIRLDVTRLPPGNHGGVIHHFLTPGDESPWKMGVYRNSTDEPTYIGRPNEANRLYHRCRVKVEWDVDADRVMTRIPTACLGNPAWVRVGSELWIGSGRARRPSFHDVAALKGDTKERRDSERLPVSRRIPHS